MPKMKVNGGGGVAESAGPDNNGEMKGMGMRGGKGGKKGCSAGVVPPGVRRMRRGNPSKAYGKGGKGKM